MITSPGGEQDVLWCLSSDPYPYQPYLIEVQTVIPLDGKVWAISEIKLNTPFLCQTSKQSSQLDEDPPLVVRQHMEPPKKFVLLTAQGAQVITKLRPVDLLRQILIDKGPDSEAVKSYFQIQKEEQACATCLILACLESQQNKQISEWATRAFFLYGGEPKAANPIPINTVPQTQAGTPYQYGFNPAMASTPRSITSGSPVQETPSNVIYSPKHNGLYIYVGRILRPLWGERIVVKLLTPTKQQYVSLDS